MDPRRTEEREDGSLPAHLPEATDEEIAATISTREKPPEREPTRFDGDSISEATDEDVAERFGE